MPTKARSRYPIERAAKPHSEMKFGKSKRKRKKSPGVNKAGNVRTGHRPDPMPTDDPVALVEWEKRNIQKD
jgi:hypothetical protein